MNGRISLRDENDLLINLYPMQFKYISRYWKKMISDRSKRSIDIIDVYSSFNNQINEKDNYIIVNSRLASLKGCYLTREIVTLSSYVDLNIDFSKWINSNSEIKKIITNKKNVYVLPYTTSNLVLDNKEIVILGPDPNISTHFDNKINAHLLFKKLNIPACQGFVSNRADNLSKFKKPFFITGKYSSGASQSSLISNNLDMFSYVNNLYPLNKKGPFLITKYVNNVSFSIEICLFLSHDKVNLISITEDVKDGFESIGGIYPCHEKIDKSIIEQAISLGKYFLKIGYFGYLGLGVFVDSKGKHYFSDINPRKQGFYGGDLLLSRNQLLNWEYDLYISHDHLNNSEKWLQNKSKPNIGFFLIKNNSNFRVVQKPQNFKKNSVFYWQQKSIVIGKTMGYSLILAKDRKELLKKISIVAKKFNQYIKNVHIHKNKLIELYWLVSDHFPKLEPIFTIYYEYIYSLFWKKGIRYCKSQDNWLKEEVDCLNKVLKPQESQKILFIGGGSLPYSAIYYSNYFKHVDILDKDLLGVFLSKRFLSLIGLNDKISVFYGNSLDIKPTLSSKYKIICIAAHLLNKTETIKKIFEIHKDAAILVRSGKGLSSKYLHNFSNSGNVKKHVLYNSCSKKQLYIYKNE